MSDTTAPTTRKKTALAPDLRRLSDRGIRAWTEQMAVHPLDGMYVVESGGTYVVDPIAGTCTCPDRELRGETCKHLRRVAIEITARRVPPPGKHSERCRHCGGDTFVTDDADPPALCPACRVEPGEIILDRETGDRLVVVDVTDERADEVEIPGVGTTVAAYPTNEGYPDDDVVVVVVYLADATRRDDPARYRFPLSRLEVTGTELIV